MPTDAKLGMVFGVGLVLLVAVLFFRRDNANPATVDSTTASVSPSPPAPPQPTTRTAGTPVSARTHRVCAGDTLPALARHYLGDEARVVELRRCNPHLPADTDELTPGLELVLPDGAAPIPPMEPASETSAELPH